MKRIFVEKKVNFREQANHVLHDLRESLSLGTLSGVRVAQRYDIDGLADEDIQKTLMTVFAEPQIDDIYEGELPVNEGDVVFAVEYLPGQFALL